MNNVKITKIIQIITKHLNVLGDDSHIKSLWNTLKDEEKIKFADYAGIFQKSDKYFFDEIEFIKYKARYVKTDTLIRHTDDVGLAISNKIFQTFEKFIKQSPKRYSFYYKGNIEEDMKNLKQLISFVDYSLFSKQLMDDNYLLTTNGNIFRKHLPCS